MQDRSQESSQRFQPRRRFPLVQPRSRIRGGRGTFLPLWKVCETAILRACLSVYKNKGYFGCLLRRVVCGDKKGRLQGNAKTFELRTRSAGNGEMGSDSVETGRSLRHWVGHYRTF